MPSTKKTSTLPKRTSAPERKTRTSTKTSAQKATAPKAPKPTAMATRVKPVRVIPTGPIVRSKTLANGEPRPKSRRSK